MLKVFVLYYQSPDNKSRDNRRSNSQSPDNRPSENQNSDNQSPDNRGSTECMCIKNNL